MGNSEQILLKNSQQIKYTFMSFLYSQFLGVFLSAVKVQYTRKELSISHIRGLCEKEDGRYWSIDVDCSATKTPINNITQCDARADGESKSESKVKTI